MHRGTGWCQHVLSALQSPNLSPPMGDVAASGCSIGIVSPAGRQQSGQTPSRSLTVADYRTDSTYALMVRVNQSDVPGPIARQYVLLCKCSDLLVALVVSAADLGISH